MLPLLCSSCLFTELTLKGLNEVGVVCAAIFTAFITSGSLSSELSSNSSVSFSKKLIKVIM